jgi:uncharacterized protein with NAD-binding domain and iron-sulfur cluster
VAKKKVAVLGGGVGAMTTAFYLTSFPGWRERYDVTVYQLGWRLGGKGASGRNLEQHARIEEHGLHMFFGFYDNAFATMQRLYGELGRNPSEPLARWDEAWKPHANFVLEEQIDGQTVPWPFVFPSNDGVPGQGGELPTPWQMIQIMLGWAKELFEKTSASPVHTSTTEENLADTVVRAADKIGASEPAKLDLRHIIHAVADLVTEGPQTLISNTFLHAAEHHARKLPPDASDHRKTDHRVIVWLLKEFIKWLKGHWREESKISIEIRRGLILLDLAVATTIGMICDELIFPPVDWFKIDQVRFEDWLMRYGADRASVESPPILLLSEIVFARWAGVGAGTCLHYTLRLALTYKGAFSYEMQAGMGDTIFAPFYEVLRRRGVRFEFFQAVEELTPGRDELGHKVIDAIQIGVQATVKGGGEYQPLVPVRGLPCWPSEPQLDQLVEGARLRESGENLENWWNRWPNVATRTLKRGVDFDEVVLGISIGAFPYVCKKLIDETPAIAQMVSTVQVTQTQAAQVWLRPDYDIMGWDSLPAPVIGTYFEPFDTLADMSHLIVREDWPPGTVGNITYLTAQLPDDGPPPTPPRSDWRYPQDQLERVWTHLNNWLDSRVGGLLPYATDTSSGSLNWGFLAGAEGHGRERLTSQFWIACWNPSDRYVLSVPGSVWSRLPSAGTGYHNLVMSGDYTLTAISSGCVEAAVMSGMHASRAMCGYPAVIVGDDLPDGGDLPPVPPTPPPRPRGRYIDIDGNNTPLQPYAAQNVTMYNFVMEADLDRLQAICDHQLNIGGPITYRPLGPFLSFVCATMGPMAPTEPRAWLDEKDFGFWIPVVAGRQDSGGFHAIRPAFFIPYLWVDDYLPQQAGREVFGYPKGVGKLVNPSSPSDPAQFTIDALVVPEYGPPGLPASQWQWKRLLTAARRGGDPWGNLVREFESVAALGEAVLASLVKELAHHTFPEPTLALLKNLFIDAVELDVPMVYLKQFRDIADGRQACYQAIVESPNRMIPGPIKAGFLPGDWELAIQQFASVRMLDTLGLKQTSPGVATAAFHFWVQFAFSAEPGKVIYRSI